MFFPPSKILWFILNPFNVILLLFVSGWLLLYKKPNLGKKLIASGLVFVFLFGLSPISNFMMQTLENRIPAGVIPDRIDGIIILVGAVNMGILRPGLIELNDQADRIVEGVILTKRHPEAKLIITGGSGYLNQSENLREADYLKKLAILLGVNEDRIVIERNSRNTHEHAVEMAKLLLDKDGGRWVLITSAFHMPRSFGCFKKEGINVIPHPVDFKTKTDVYTDFSLLSLLPKISNISSFSNVLHEWLGLIAYWMAGHTDSLFPAIE